MRSNNIFRYFLTLVLAMSTSVMIAQDLIIDHKKLGQLEAETIAALNGQSVDAITKVTVISNTETKINANDVRGLKGVVTKVKEFDFSRVMTEGFDASAFDGYTTLVKISLPSNMTIIPKYCFRKCANLTTVTNWDKIKVISLEAFMECVKFNPSVLPSTLEEIHDNAFKACTALSLNTLPDGLKKIGVAAFRQSNVTFSEWPSAIEEIGGRAFCITPVTFTTWPENIPTMQPGVFINCYKITKFTVPASVTAIGGAVFRMDQGVKRDIYMCSKTPISTIVDTAEGGNNSDNPFCSSKTDFASKDFTTIHIPASGKSLYEAAPYWKNMKYATKAYASTILSGTWSQLELTQMDVTDANLTDIDMTGITVPADVTLSGVTNPNLLVYLKAGDNITLDKGYTIVDGKIADIALTDNMPFNASKEFTADAISYTRPVVAKVNGKAALETICLPFNCNIPNGCTVEEMNTTSAESVTFKTASTIAANTPYILYNEGTTDIKFDAVSQTINNQMNFFTDGGPYTFNGTYATIDVTAETGENIMYISDGKEFRLTGKGATVIPFRAFLKGEARTSGQPSYATAVKVESPVSIESVATNNLSIYSAGNTLYVNVPEAQKLDIYGIDGRLVRSEMLVEGENELSGLNRGIYVIEKNKVVIK